MLHVFIINSFAGKGNFSDEIRSLVEKEENIEYLIFNSEYAGHEGILAKQICELFEDENIRFYACGGSGTFRNILKSLPSEGRYEIAEIPYGMTNDFQICFGNDRARFLDIKSVIKGRCEKLDYIDTNMGAVHNGISLGFDTKIIEFADRLNVMSVLGGGFVYPFAGIYALFKRTDFTARVEADGECFVGAIEQITIINGRVLGGMFNMVDETSVKDGLVKVIIFPRTNIFRKIGYYFALITNKMKYLKKHCIIYDAKEIKVKNTDETEIKCNADGELERGKVLECHVIQKGMNYIVPKDIGGVS